jgi:hypothetical protein
MAKGGIMNIRPAIALSLVLMAGTALSSGQARARVTGSAPRHATAAPAPAASTSAPPPHTSSLVPPGWGLAPGPASTVNHPGGVPSTYATTTAQPVSGIQPLIPTGTFASVGPSTTRGRASQVVVVPVYVPVGVYPAGAMVSGYGGDANTAQAADQYPPDTPGTYAQAAALPVYSEQMDSQAPAYPPNTAQSAPPSDSNAPGPADVSYTLLAFKDHSIFAVTDYWVDNNRLNYVTNYGTTGTAALDQLDLSLTLKLNNDHGVTFELHGK